MSEKDFSKYDFDSFAFFDVGIVHDNKPRSTNNIFATPISVFPFASSKLTRESAKVEAKGVDALGTAYSTSAETVNAQEYRWLPTGFQTTAPDVRKGERVFLYRYADTDEYFWVSSQLDRSYRRLETGAFMFQADPNADDKDEWSEENCYTFTVSTHDGHITLTTSQKNKEPFGYVMQLNTKDGIFTLTDNEQNLIQLVSAEQLIVLKNKNGTYFAVDKDDLKGYAPQNIYFKAETLVEFLCKNFVLKASEDITFETKVWTVNASESISFDTQTFNWKAQTTNIDSPTINIKGNIFHEGNQTTSGTMGVGGATTLGGGVSVSGSMTNNGKDVGSGHKHTGSATAPSGPVSPTGTPV
jgi:hypothetical protein